MSLHDLQKKKRTFTLEQVQYITREIVKGLAHLHAQGVAHRDLKESNILLNMQSQEITSVRIADFGLGKKLGNDSRDHTPDMGTITHRAFEITIGYKKQTCAVDMWSLGCILVKLLTGKDHFRESSELAQLHSIFKVFGTCNDWEHAQHLKVKWPKCDANLHLLGVDNVLALDLICKLFTFDPSKRITAVQALKHPFLLCTPGKSVCLEHDSSKQESITPQYNHNTQDTSRVYPKIPTDTLQQESPLHDGRSLVGDHVRLKCINQIKEWAEGQKYSTRTVYHAWALLDKCILHFTVKQDQVENIALTCLLMASKMNECNELTIDRCKRLMPNICSAGICNCEKTMVNAFNGVIDFPTVWDHLHDYALQYDMIHKIKEAHDKCLSFLAKKESLEYKYRDIALASLLVVPDSNLHLVPDKSVKSIVTRMQSLQAPFYSCSLL
jgi:hypothetical protein